MSGFVKPISVWTPLDGQPVGDSVEIKKELNTGDQKRLEAAGMRRVQRPQPNGTYAYELEIDIETFEIARADVWLTDWAGPSFLNDDGSKHPYSASALKALNVETFERISAAVQKHVAQIEQEKKLKTSATASSDATPSTS